MVLDFLTSDWGRLRDGDKCALLACYTSSTHEIFNDAHVLFKPGKMRDGWFSADNLLAQVDRAIDIFEGLTKGWAQGLFLFDNGPSHQKRTDDAISARRMVKGVYISSSQDACLTYFPAPRKGWAHNPGSSRMRPSTLPNGKTQYFYFPEDHPTMPNWFKGMEVIIWERDLWPEDGKGLPAQCPQFKCPADRTDCCCRQLLFNQPNFCSQKSQLQEYIESRNHLCDFYPKYHCELNFIKQYWGAAKFQYRTASRASTLKDMETIVKECLDGISLLQIRQ